MEILAIIVMLALPALVVVTLLLTLQARSRLKQAERMVQQCYKRALSDDIAALAAGRTTPEMVNAYVDGIMSEDA